MQDLISQLDAIIAQRPLLGHPFYQDWSAGELSLAQLRDYACQYYHFERAFPRFLSSLHARCEDAGLRQALLDNLWDEEHGHDNHLALWLRFCEGLGLSEAQVSATAPLPETEALVRTYRWLCATGEVSEGVAALYAYESQAPAVARQKIAGLSRFYGIDDARTVSFFTTHADLDAEHAASEAYQLIALTTDAAGRAAVLEATTTARDALWSFLDGSLRDSCAAAAAL